MSHDTGVPAWRIYTGKRVAPLLLLGLASGLPLALTGGTLQAWATVENAPLEQIGFLTLVGTAYTLKFLWAPLVDRFVPPLLGRRRGWMLVTQLLLAAAIMAMSLLSPSKALLPLALLAVGVAFLSATQDIAFDAYRTDILRKEERGAGVALSVMGYRLGMLMSGGLALILADRWLGWNSTYFLMGAVMGLMALVTLLAPEPERPVQAPRSLQAALVEPFREFFGRPEAWTLLALIVLYKLGDAFAGALSTTFLIRGAGFTVEQVGWANKILGLSATILGALMGGAILARLGLYRSLMLFGLMQAVSNLGYWAVAVSPEYIAAAGASLGVQDPAAWGKTVHLAVMVVAVGVENLCGGLGTAASVALVMSMCDARFTATQFALLSALSAVGRTYLAGPLTPPLVKALDWPGFFLLTVLIALPGLVLLRRRRADIERADAGRDQDEGVQSGAA